MINYRIYNPETDKDELKRLCEKYNGDFPTTGLLLVAMDGDRMIASIGLRAEYHIDTLIAENALAGYRLFNKIEDIIAKEKIQRVQCVCEPKLKELYKKAGFQQVDAGKIILEKNYGV